jgi:Zn finger protein HypA/HybF involved in hydrogenase expression
VAFISKSTCAEDEIKEDMALAQAYCFKCRAKREIKNAKKVVLKDGRLQAIQGVCPYCGAKIFRIEKG